MIHERGRAPRIQKHERRTLVARVERESALGAVVVEAHILAVDELTADRLRVQRLPILLRENRIGQHGNAIGANPAQPVRACVEHAVVAAGNRRLGDTGLVEVA